MIGRRRRCRHAVGCWLGMPGLPLISSPCLLNTDRPMRASAFLTTLRCRLNIGFSHTGMRRWRRPIPIVTPTRLSPGGTFAAGFRDEAAEPLTPSHRHRHGRRLPTGHESLTPRLPVRDHAASLFYRSEWLVLLVPHRHRGHDTPPTNSIRLHTADIARLVVTE